MAHSPDLHYSAQRASSFPYPRLRGPVRARASIPLPLLARAHYSANADEMVMIDGP